MKSQLLKRIFILASLTLLLAGSSFAATTFDWAGNASTGSKTDWTNPRNWVVGTTTQTVAYPGFNGTSATTTDIVRIGVSTSVATFTNYPVLAKSLTIASLTFGNNHALVNNNAGGIINFTVNNNGAVLTTLTVTGTIQQNHSTTGGVAGTGGTTVDDFEDFTYGIQTTLSGTGSIICASFVVGDTGLPTNNNVVNVTAFRISNVATSSLSITVNGTFTLNSASSSTGGFVTRSSRALVSIGGGSLTVNGTIKMTNTNPGPIKLAQYEALVGMSLDLNFGSTNSPVLNMGGLPALNINLADNTANSIDFYNPLGGTGTCTANYTGTGNQIVNTGGSNATDVDPSAVYQNIGFSGSGTKTADGGTLSVVGNFTLSAGTETVDLSTNNPTTTISGNYSTATGTTLTNGTGAFTVSGTSYANSGTSNFGTGLVTFNSAATTAFTGTGKSNFTNVTFTGNNTNNMTGGAYNVISTGVLTMGGTSTQLNAGGNLTLVSDVNGAATVAAIPTGCQVNGNVKVQRFVSANRAYRLVSSSVTTGAANGNNIYSINYLLTNAYLTGTDNTGGTVGAQFDKIGNPTLYLYRENLAPAYTSFLNSNFRGIQNISSPPNYTINSDPVNTDPGTYNIPVGNGFLFYFRGSRKQKTLAQLTTAGAAATTDTLNAVGTLNQGNITVHDWYTPTVGTLGYTTASNDHNIEGLNLVGNPYASSIDWDQYGTGIVETKVTKFSYKLIPTGLQAGGNYDVYAAGTANKKGTQGTANANIIASGEGFFVQAIDATASLTFTEAAKTNTLVTGANLYMAKLPVTAAVPRFLRLQLAKDSINTDGTIISFEANSASAFNTNEDARYRTGTGVVSLSSITSDNVAVAINTLPLAIKGQSIGLKVSATTNGSYTLNLKDITGIPQLYDVCLKDAYTKDSVNMRKTPAYSFNIALSDTNSFGSKRFSLVLSQDTAFSYKLLSFDAGKIDKKRQVEVIWKTVNEENYTYFTVQRSTDNGKSFDVIGSILSDGQGTYSLIDKNPAKGENLYRLKQEDYNSNITFSKVVDVKLSDNGNDNNVRLHVYPNPAINNITLDIDPKSQHVATYKIRISNSFGTVVKQVVTKQTNWQDNVSQLFTGTYLIQVINDKDNTLIGQTKFVKL